MSDESWNIAAPPFNPEATLQTLKRFLRDQHVLAERSEGWLLNGRLVLKLAVDGVSLKAQLAKRPAHAPEWEAFSVKSTPDSRKLQDEIKRRLLRWRSDE